MLRLNKDEDEIQTLVVTGGSSGIGKEFIKQYTKYNKNILVCNLSRTKPGVLNNFYNSKHIAADFTDPDNFAQARFELLSFLEKNHSGGGIMLVNNSGFGSFGIFHEDDVNRDSRMIDVNVKAPVLLTAALFPLLKKFGGKVVNISSIAAYQPTPYFITYGASKSFLSSWSLGLWRENIDSNIKVITICPGPTSTDFFEHAGLDETSESGRGMTVEVVVKKMIRAIQKNQPLMIPGWMNRLIASFAGILPNTWITRIAYRAIQSQELK